MHRIDLDYRNVKKEKLNTGTATQIYKMKFRDGTDDDLWFQKLEKDPYFYDGGDMRELFASEIADILNVSNVEVRLGNDKFTDFVQKTSFSRSFIQPGEQYVEAHSFFPQYRINRKEVIGNMQSNNLYTIEIASYQGKEYKYIISHNIEDLKFYDLSMREAIEREKVRLQYMGNVNKIMEEQYKIWFQDYLLENRDRSAKNWGIILNNSNKRIKSAPSFDNTELFGRKYIHLHGLNVSPECMIKYLLEYKSEEIASCIQGVYQLENGELDEILKKYDEPGFDRESARSFILERIKIMKDMMQEIEDEKRIAKPSKGNRCFDNFAIPFED